VKSTVRVDDIAHYTGLQCERSLLKRLLHLPSSKPAQISASAVGGAVGMLLGYLSELLRRTVDICLVSAQDLLSLLLAPSNIGLFPAGWSSAARVFDQNVARPHLPRTSAITAPAQQMSARQLLDLVLRKIAWGVPG